MPIDRTLLVMVLIHSTDNAFYSTLLTAYLTLSWVYFFAMGHNEKRIDIFENFRDKEETPQ